MPNSDDYFDIFKERNLKIHAARYKDGRTLKSIAEEFGVSPERVGYIAREIERRYPAYLRRLARQEEEARARQRKEDEEALRPHRHVLAEPYPRPADKPLPQRSLDLISHYALIYREFKDATKRINHNKPWR